MFQNQTPGRYILYARKSSESEDRQMASIENQIHEMKRVADKLNLNVIETISEAASAKAPGRKGFKRLMEMIRENNADSILCWKLNRIARNANDGGEFIHMLQMGQIKSIQTFERQYLPNDNVIPIMLEIGMATQFIKDLSSDTKRGLRDKARRGWYPGKAPIGYLHNSPRYSEGTSVEIVPDPKRYKLVKMVFEKMRTGQFTAAEIHRESMRLGLLNKKGNPYKIDTITKMLTNEFYAGFFYWRDENGEIQRFKGKHRKMVGLEDIESISRRLTGNSNLVKRGRFQYSYQGVFKCGECGYSVYADRKIHSVCRLCKKKFSSIKRKECPDCSEPLRARDPRRTYTYYGCTKKGGPCTQLSMDESAIDSQIRELTARINISEKFFQIGLKCLERIKDLDISDSKSLIENLIQKRTRINIQLDRMTEMLVNGQLEPDDHKRLKQKKQKELIEIEKEIEIRRSGANLADGILLDRLRTAREVSNLFKSSSPSKKRQLTLNLGANHQIVNKTTVIEVHKSLFMLSKLSKEMEEFYYRCEPTKVLDFKARNREYIDFKTLIPFVLPKLVEVRNIIEEELHNQTK